MRSPDVESTKEGICGETQRHKRSHRKAEPTTLYEIEDIIGRFEVERKWVCSMCWRQITEENRGFHN